MPTPAVSVVMSVYNGLPYLEEAVGSVLHQTFEDFEFIIINDGSTDGSGAVLERMGGQDSRIRLFHQENQGLAAALNRGIDAARGPYIARMDDDDISFPKRLERQVQFLDAHPEVGVLGTQISSIDAEGNAHPSYWALPTTPGLTAWRTLFRCSLCHPAVMMRREVVTQVGGYDASLQAGQDTELWSRLVLRTRLQSLPEVLLQRRMWGGNTTIKRSQVQDENAASSMAPLHERILGESADPAVLSFVRWQQHGGALEAAETLGVGPAVARESYAHVWKLHRAFARRFAWAREDRRSIAEDACGKLADIAQVASADSNLTAWALKARAFTLVPERIPQWLGQKLRRSIGS